MRDAKRSVGNLAHVEGSICAFYLHQEIHIFALIISRVWACWEI